MSPICLFDAIPDTLILAAGGGGEQSDEFWRLLRGLLLLVGGSFLLGLIFERFRQNALLGYLLAGLLLGPHALSLVRLDTTVDSISELGVTLLLFTIGLEFSLSQLRQLGLKVLLAGAAQVIVTLLVVMVGVQFFETGWKQGFVLGGMVALSSTACVLRVLVDRTELDSQHGRSMLAVLLVQDLAVVPLVLAVTLMSRGGAGPMAVGIELGRTLLWALLLVSMFYLLCQIILPRVLAHPTLARTRDLPILLAMFSAIGSAWAAHMVGLSPALGAFVAGMLLGDSPFAHQLRADVSPLKTLFVTIFFASVGMLAVPSWIFENILAVLLAAATLIIVKAVLVWGTLRMFGRADRVSVAAGLGLAQVGEFSFVLAGIARGAEGAPLLEEDNFRLMVAATLVTLVVTPYLVAVGPWLGGRVERLMRRLRGSSEAQASDAMAAALAGIADGDGAATGHVVVIGFGPAGQGVCEVLRRLGRRVVVCELNTETAGAARDAGFEVHIGDACQPDVLDHLPLSTASALVVTLPDIRACEHVIQMSWPALGNAPIITRCRYHRFAKDLADAGAVAVVDEEVEVGRRLGAEVRRRLRRDRNAARDTGDAHAPPL